MYAVENLVSVHAACQFASIVFDSLQPYGLYPARILCPWDSPGKNTGMGCHALQFDFSNTGIESRLLLVSCIGRQVLYHKHHQGSPWYQEYSAISIQIFMLGRSEFSINHKSFLLSNFKQVIWPL